MTWLKRQKLFSPQLSWGLSVLPNDVMMCVCPLCLWVALAQAACSCLLLGCSSAGRTQTLLFFEVPWLYSAALPLGCVMHLSVSCISCGVAACGTAFLELKSPYHSLVSFAARLLTPIPSARGAAALTRDCSWHACRPFLGSPASSMEGELRLCGCVS